MVELESENNITSQGIHTKSYNNSPNKLTDNINEKISTKESKSLLSSDGKSSDSGSGDESDKKSEESNECGCDNEHNADLDHHHPTKAIKKKQPDSRFYEKQMLEKKENEKKYEKIRKRKEEEIIKRAKPIINEESKKIMDKKQGFVKPIYQRAKEIEEIKNKKLVIMKKTIDEKKAKKDEDELLKSKFVIKNKHFNEKEFTEWRNHTLDWENQKKKKIDDQKEKNKKSQLETTSKFYHPNIDKRSEDLVNKSKVINANENISVFDKLYNNNEEKQKKLLQKAIESLPGFKPTINKNVPSYIRNKPQINYVNYTTEYFNDKYSKQASNHKYTNSIEIPLNKSNNQDYKNVYNTVSTISQSDRTKKTKMNSSVIETITNPIIISDDDDDDEHDDIVSKYKNALELTNHNSKSNSIANNTNNGQSNVVVEINNKKEININSINSLSNKNSNSKINDSKITVTTKAEVINKSYQYSSEKNKEKIELYNQKIAALLSSIKKNKNKKKF